MIGEIEHEFDHLRQENANLTVALQRSHEKNVKLLQTLQRKEQYLQAAQQRIEKLEREVHMVRGVAGHMQNWEGRLAACEKMIPIYQQSCKENVQPVPVSNDGARMNKQGHVPRLRRSGQSTTWKVKLPPSQQSPGPVQQPAVDQKLRLDGRD
jgi:chromosome segregation ATPase